MNLTYWLPVIFAGLLTLSMLIYVVLDGYDLGIGLLLPRVERAEKTQMLATIGPFWDANETWLVLGIGLLLAAFPAANSLVSSELYLPLAFMLGGLIIRGVAFDFRVKAREPHQPLWDSAFFVSSLLVSLMQGLMLGRYLMGFSEGWVAWGFAWLTALCLCTAYALLGASWLILKTTGLLQARAYVWAKQVLLGAIAAVALVSIATPLASPAIAVKWFALPQFLLLLPLPLVTFGLFALLNYLLPRLARRQAQGDDRYCWVPFVLCVSIVLLSFWGLAYSIFPDIVISKMTIWQAASDTEALWAILVVAAVVLPVVLAYTAYVYRVFHGKAATELSYD
ncbi:cytochrome d ubiquinol oxidase subunit II [Iodobacter fluviatilis]|jgi:cytochrome d ubiquinol oxidase subunit II|uniref:Cytochrome BD ubiquinol oxidase subunit II n=1 Tax=Iodobacter fluviatilis TaxID=537 RepID=A0A7G3GC96_9NEIS|nr:cytochrome d ubiquinol oxidase subunit II [Iodobacter fluviatilis]QBC44774.1 cytochrome BD ubiquinol oxidase subunit II [Iodobacter fluviatilis]